MRLIDADKIRWESYPNDYGETNDDYVGKCDIDNMPTVDAVPVVHGRWIPFHSKISGDIQYCSACEIGFVAKSDYCPHCGAMMDGGEE